MMAEQDDTRAPLAEEAIAPAGGATAPPSAVREPITIRPSRTDAENDVDKFATLFKEFRNPETLSAKKLAQICKVSTSTISRYTAKGDFPEEYRRPILKYLFEEQDFLLGETRRQLGEINDALYFAFLNFVDVKETSQDSARAKVVGTYKLWRYSVEHNDEFVFGKITFREDPKTRAVRAEMVQPKQPNDGTRGSVERCSGYLFRVSHMYLMLLCDDLTKDVRMTIFPRVKMDLIGTDVNPRTGNIRPRAAATDPFENPRCAFLGSTLHIVHMDGFGLGIDGSSGFFSPVHLSLVDSLDDLAELDENLNVVPKGDKRIPARVAKKLKRNGPLRRL
jgi:hypothetical protein